MCVCVSEDFLNTFSLRFLAGPGKQLTGGGLYCLRTYCWTFEDSGATLQEMSTVVQNTGGDSRKEGPRGHEDLKVERISVAAGDVLAAEGFEE